MKKRFPRALLAAWCLGIGLSLSACSIESGEGLASLPRLPGEYLALQQKVDAILDKGYVPAVAESGAALGEMAGAGDRAAQSAEETFF